MGTKKMASNELGAKLMGSKEMERKEYFTFRQNMAICNSIKQGVSEDAFYSSKFSTLEAFIADGITNASNLVVLQPKKMNRFTPYGGRRINNKFKDFLNN